MLRSLAPAAGFLSTRVRSRPLPPANTLHAPSSSSVVANRVQVDYPIALFTCLSDTFRYRSQVEMSTFFVFFCFYLWSRKGKADNGLLARHLWTAIVYIESGAGLFVYFSELNSWVCGIKLLRLPNALKSTCQERFKFLASYVFFWITLEICILCFVVTQKGIGQFSYKWNFSLKNYVRSKK